MNPRPKTNLVQMEPNLSSPWNMLFWLLSVLVTVAIVGRSLAPLGPLIGEELLLTKTQIGLLPATLYLGQLVVSLPSGIMVDKWGAKYLLLGLCVILGVSFILLSFLSEINQILIVIFIGGLGFGMIHTTTNSGIVSWFPLRKRGTAMGIKQMGVTAGSALATILLLPVALIIGWRLSIFLASLTVMLIGFIAFYNYKDNQQTEIINHESTWTAFKKNVMQIIKNKFLWFISIAAAVISGIQISWNTFIVFYTHEKFGLSLLLASSLLVISELSGSFGRVLWGVISDTIFKGKRVIVFVIITLFTVICCMALAFLPDVTPLYFIYIIAIFFGFCVSGFNGIWMNLATESVSRKTSGLASGFSITIGSTGIVVVPPLFGLIIDQTATYMFGWIFLILLSTCILFLLFISMRLEKQIMDV